MSNSRKFLIALLLVLTVGLGGISFYVANRIQQDQAAQDTSAAGFGETATRDLYETVTETLKNTPCEYFMKTDDLATILKNNGTDVVANDIKVSKATEHPTLIPLICNYTIKNSKKIRLAFYTYEKNSNIASSQEELIGKSNIILLSTLVDSGEFTTKDQPVSYTFGESRYPYEKDAKACTGILFHDQNEFEFAELVYQSFNTTDCKDVQSLNKAISNPIATKIDDLIKRLTEENKQK